MFLKHKQVSGIDDCPIHSESEHVYEFVRYNVAKARVVIRLRCIKCQEASIDGWNYYEVTAMYWLEFLMSNGNKDFTGAS